MYSPAVIPALAHFVWLGESFPWVNLLAMRSAVTRGGFERVILHHTDRLAGSDVARECAALPRTELRHIEPEQLLGAMGPVGIELTGLYRRVRSPVGRSNILRIAILALEGGVYFDMDTITVGDLTPMRREARCFCGDERIVLPAAVLRSRDPAVVAATGARLAVRDLCRRLPRGHRLFRRIEHRFPRGANFAVGGAEPRHPFLIDYLARMARVPRRQEQVRNAIGTTMLQDALGAWSGHGLVVYPPPVFYPVPPEISTHWFRPRRTLALEEFLRPETRVVHWYASVRTRHILPRLDREHIVRNALREPFSALVRPLLEC